MGHGMVGLLRSLRGKESARQCQRHRRCGCNPQEDSLEEEIATHSSIFAWKILWPEESGGHRPQGCRVGYDMTTEHIHTVWQILPLPLGTSMWYPMVGTCTSGQTASEKESNFYFTKYPHEREGLE